MKPIIGDGPLVSVGLSQKLQVDGNQGTLGQDMPRLIPSRMDDNGASGASDFLKQLNTKGGLFPKKVKSWKTVPYHTVNMKVSKYGHVSNMLLENASC